MQTALVDSNGIVQNFIVYDGVSPYTPPTGQTIQQVNDWCVIGQPENMAQPVASPATILIPDLATQLASLLVANGTIAATDINSTTLTQVNATLTAAGQSTIAMTLTAVKS